MNDWTIVAISAVLGAFLGWTLGKLPEKWTYALLFVLLLGVIVIFALTSA